MRTEIIRLGRVLCLLFYSIDVQDEVQFDPVGRHSGLAVQAIEETNFRNCGLGSGHFVLEPEWDSRAGNSVGAHR
jgi:hypothetical protein